MMKNLIFSIFFLCVSKLSFASKSAPFECKGKKLTEREMNQREELLKKSNTYKSLLRLKPRKTYINISSCTVVKSYVNLSYIEFNDILGKTCSINSMSFNLQFIDGEVVFDKLPFKVEKLSAFEVNRSLLKETLEAVANHDKITKFFSKNNFCQVQYENPATSSSPFVVLLRNAQGESCSVRSSLYGREFEILKRIYTKSSSCF